MTKLSPIKRDWPADKVERRAVADLIPYARNARTHSEAQVAQIAASIREWGWTVPVLVDEAGTIIAGHGRVLAAQKLGLDTVPVMVAAGWSEAQTRAYVLADNQLALNAGWDQELLKIELGDLEASGFDLGLIGFDGLPDLVGIAAEADEAGPGSAGLTLKIGKLEIPLSEDERERLEALAKDYAIKHGMYFGFAAFLCDAAEA